MTDDHVFSADRRTFMRHALAATSLPLVSQIRDAQAQAPTRVQAETQDAAAGTRLVLLGTKGGPTPSTLRAAPANLLTINGRPYVVDCDNGVATQLTKAGVKLSRLQAIFLTHHHSDHNADLGNLVLLAWASGLTTPVHIYGPPPIKDMIASFMRMNVVDIETRMREEGRPPFKDLIVVHEFDEPGLVLENDQVRVSCALVDHYTLKPALAYRFDTPGRSVVFSGDTTYSENLIRLAQGADVLVHEVMYLPALEKLMRTVDGAPTLLDHLVKSHTTTEQVGRIAAAAGVKTLVLSHFVPGGDPAITDEMWSKEARQYFHGDIIVGRDLMAL
ncbi:MBL fold metallo-hydrolase [Methylobacterium sp. J-072]|uniref:MBL fold metallo-hydrolase n=1 Tax=Methylobacterium sp. J-072 TaxID=2836651 RepID=UPI001FBC0897|nr:MBL fold metallo-hydrolase [Methylobacterium sp. J-072]MCJ2096463.1 MBL fold metallo-hydrolase [Methylobacterium sp. J-072]